MKRPAVVLFFALLCLAALAVIMSKRGTQFSNPPTPRQDDTAKPVLQTQTSPAKDRRPDKSRLAVMTINTFWMWDGVEPEEGRSTLPIPWRGNQEEAEKHMQEIAKIIRRNNPDIVNLVEIENDTALNTLNDNFLAEQGYKAYFVQGKDTFTGQDVGLLSRIEPVEFAREDRDGQSGAVFKSVTKNYYAKFDIAGRRIALIGVHFLANPVDKRRTNQRQAQADAIGRLAEELRQEGDVIVLGDINDYDPNVLDHVDSKPITNVIKRFKDAGLVNAATFIPKQNRYTIFYDANRDGKIDHPQEHTSIDHILISPSLESSVAKVTIDHQVDVWKVSDHYPIIMWLRIE